ncbi:MFS transporter AraJ [Bacteroides xylanisolvens]|nr:MFS transporter AraJ [Bacteroides xylanisolvens]
MKKSLIALAFGTLGLGIAEFVMMGILPDVAKDLGISIPVAGHFISAYALGVCVGAPVLTLARKYPLKHILLVLVTLIMIGNICAALSPNYFGYCLPHVSSPDFLMEPTSVSALLLPSDPADKGKGSEAVSIMIAGMTIANLFGVPLGTSLSTMLSWRATFLLVGIWGIVIMYYIWRWVPHVEGLKDTGFKGQFRFLKTPAPWLILGATALSNGGVFCWYSYINPMLTNVSGFSAESITPLMILAGFGMVMGNLISGRLSDRYTPGKVGTVAQALICIMLLLLFFLSPYKWAAALLMCLCTAGLFAVSNPEQVLIIRVAKGGEMLGAASVQVAFNLGNAIGAYAGGPAISEGYRYPALTGVPFALIGFILFLIFYKKYQFNPNYL